MSSRNLNILLFTSICVNLYFIFSTSSKVEVIDNSQEVGKAYSIIRSLKNKDLEKNEVIDSLNKDIVRIRHNYANEKRKKEKLDDIKNFTTDSATINAIDVAFANRSL